MLEIKLVAVTGIASDNVTLTDMRNDGWKILGMAGHGSRMLVLMERPVTPGAEKRPLSKTSEAETVRG